ncbi:hypothetical protein ABFT51_27825 (plasmid) [Paenibacillus peoriae]
MKKKMVFFLAVSFSFGLMFVASAQAPFEHYQASGVISTQGYIGGA